MPRFYDALSTINQSPVEKLSRIVPFLKITGRETNPRQSSRSEIWAKTGINWQLEGRGKLNWLRSRKNLQNFSPLFSMEQIDFIKFKLFQIRMYNSCSLIFLIEPSRQNIRTLCMPAVYFHPLHI